MIIPESKTIEDILGSTRNTFSVPNYQRNFDWGKSELQELIDDLKGLTQNQAKELFLGNFIFDISNKNEHKIVDGQQRLTTISIIFIAIREHAKILNEHDLVTEAQKFISVYSKARGSNNIKISVSKNIRYIYEFMSNPKWNGTFPDKIEGSQIKRQVNKVKPIYNFIKDSLSEYNIDLLRDFMVGLLDTYVVVLEVNNDQDIFSVFERTNARGLDLNIGDLLKNYIFSHKQNEFEDKWNEIVENANGSLPRLLKYFWISRKGYIQQSSLYREMKKYVGELDASSSKTGINIFVEDLYEFSRFYKVVQSQENEIVQDWFEEIGLTIISNNEDYYKRITRVFQALKLFKVTQAYPVIYSIIKYFKSLNTTNAKMLFKALENIEKYHFVNNVISGRVGHEVEKFYAESASEFFENKNENFSSEINGFLTKLNKKKALKDEFKSNFIDTVVYNKSNIGIINYVYDRINNFDGKSDPVKGAQYVNIFSPEKDLQKRNYNIEHFLPLNNKKKYSDVECEQFDKIGNLLVISRHTNSDLKDKSPCEKIDIIKSDRKNWANLRYFDDFLETYKNEFENWNFESIDRRSEEIAENAYMKIWNF
jgi:uncharacterized protein with ParB-like and HNH nuclease domain